MKLPVDLKNVLHSNGGTITRIFEIRHEAHEPSHGRSTDVWFFVGTVKWNDGTESERVEIAPWALAYDEDDTEVRSLMTLLNEYLNEHGEWCDQESGHDGWYAHRNPSIAVTLQPGLKRVDLDEVLAICADGDIRNLLARVPSILHELKLYRAIEDSVTQGQERELREQLNQMR